MTIDKIPPVAASPPINPTTIPSQGRNTFEPAVIPTSPPNIPVTNCGISKRYSRRFFCAALSNIAANPPPIPPFTVTTATRLAIFQLSREKRYKKITIITIDLWYFIQTSLQNHLNDPRDAQGENSFKTELFTF